MEGLNCNRIITSLVVMDGGRGGFVIGSYGFLLVCFAFFAVGCFGILYVMCGYRVFVCFSGGIWGTKYLLFYSFYTSA